MVLGLLAGGRTIDDVLGDHPHLERDDALAVPACAAPIVNEREMPLARPA